MPILKNARHERFAQELAAGKSTAEAATLAELELKDCHPGLTGYYVYLLIDPQDGAVFYIGKGKGRRYSSHFKEWNSGTVTNAHKFARIGLIVAAGLKPVAKCLMDGLSGRAALHLEAGLIKEIGRERLTNWKSGVPSEAARALVRLNDLEARIMPYYQWVRTRPAGTRIEMYQEFLDECVETRAFIEGVLESDLASLR